MICEALAKSFDTFLRFLDCPEVPSESEAISEQWNAIVLRLLNMLLATTQREGKSLLS